MNEEFHSCYYLRTFMSNVVSFEILSDHSSFSYRLQVSSLRPKCYRCRLFARFHVLCHHMKSEAGLKRLVYLPFITTRPSLPEVNKFSHHLLEHRRFLYELSSFFYYKSAVMTLEWPPLLSALLRILIRISRMFCVIPVIGVPINTMSPVSAFSHYTLRSHCVLKDSSWF